MVQSPQNRRRHIRINHSQIVSYTHYTKDDEIDKFGGVGTTADLSMGGLLMRVTDEFQNGTKIDLDISLGEELISVAGQIVRVHKINEDLYDIGVMFLEVSDEDIQKLKTYFAERNIPI